MMPQASFGRTQREKSENTEKRSILCVLFFSLCSLWQIFFLNKKGTIFRSCLLKPVLGDRYAETIEIAWRVFPTR